MTRVRKTRPLSDILGTEHIASAPKSRAGRPVEDHRQQLVLAQAEGQRLKNAKARGELVEIATVEAEWAKVALDVRAAMLALPSRLGARLGLTPAQVAKAAEEVRDALTTLADDRPAP